MVEQGLSLEEMERGLRDQSARFKKEAAPQRAGSLVRGTPNDEIAAELFAAAELVADARARLVRLQEADVARASRG